MFVARLPPRVIPPISSVRWPARIHYLTRLSTCAFPPSSDLDFDPATLNFCPPCRSVPSMVIARRQRETQARHVRKNFLFFSFLLPLSFHLAGWPAPTWPGSSHSVREFIPERRRSATPTRNLYRKIKIKKSPTRGRCSLLFVAHKRHLRITHTHIQPAGEL